MVFWPRWFDSSAEVDRFFSDWINFVQNVQTRLVQILLTKSLTGCTCTLPCFSCSAPEVYAEDDDWNGNFRDEDIWICNLIPTLNFEIAFIKYGIFKILSHEQVHYELLMVVCWIIWKQTMHIFEKDQSVYTYIFVIQSPEDLEFQSLNFKLQMLMKCTQSSSSPCELWSMILLLLFLAFTSNPYGCSPGRLADW
jgi:hypothetical protein